MAGAGKEGSIRAMGIYLIILLALLRFLIYPLYNGLERQKQILDEQKKSLTLKTRLLNQQQGGAPLAAFVGRERLTLIFTGRSKASRGFNWTSFTG